MYSKELLEKVLDNWNINISRTRDDVSIAGSPERVDYRKVIEADNSGLYIIEQVAEDTIEHKTKIANALEYLRVNNLTYVKPYLKTKDSQFLLKAEDAYWQVVEYIKGKELIRPDYIEDSWRGKVLAEFLVSLRKKAEVVPGFAKQEIFSIKEYISDVLLSFKHQPQVISRLTAVLDFLEDDFFKAHDSLKPSFCHGDYHPINIIWGEKGINSIIDWEFSGYKPEIYDIACMIGCVGIEGPKAFASALVQKFLRTIQESGLWDELSLKYLLEYIVAQRFAWISEWVRKDNKDMLEFEIGYTNAMVENRDIIKRVLKI